MASLMYKSMWTLMSNGNLIFEATEGLACVLCKKLLIDACQSSCGCQYCYDCIIAYISTDIKCCPGNMEYCLEAPLVFSSNVFRNMILNKRVSKVKVHCTNRSCTCIIELIQLEEHLRLCPKRPMECPYVAIGCNIGEGDVDSIDRHLHGDNVSHAVLLMESITNVKNEVNALKEHLEEIDRGNINMEGYERRMEDLRLDSENVAAVVNEMQMKVNRQTELNQMYLNADGLMERDYLKLIVTELRNEMKDEIEKVSLRVESLAEGPTDGMNKILRSEVELKRISPEIEMKEEKRNTDQSNNVTAASLGTRKCDGEYCTKSMLQWIKLCTNMNLDFLWRVDECSKKINTNIYSEPFYSGRCRWCLLLYIDSCTNVHLQCYVMKGDNDDTMEWPIMRAVTLSVLHLDTQRSYLSDTCQGTFSAPIDGDLGDHVGTLWLVRYSSNEQLSSIFVNDSIVVSCLFSDK